MSFKEKLSTHKKKILAIGIPVGILLALGIAFGSYCGYYALGNKALPGVQIGSVKVHGKTESQLTQQLEKADKNLKVTFTNADNKQYSISDLGYKLDAKATAQKALAYNNSFKNYFRALFKNYTVVPVFTTDGEKLIATSNELSKNYKNAVAAVEPTTKFDKESGSFKVVAGKEGTGAQPDSLIVAAKKAIYGQKDLKTTVEYGPVKPVATTADAEKLTVATNKMLNRIIKISTTGTATNKNFTPNKATVASWLTIPLSASHDNPNFDVKKAQEWLDSIKKEVVIAPTKGYRYVSPSGKTLRVITNAKDGVDVTNFDQINTDFTAALKKNEDYSGVLSTKVSSADWKNKTVDPGAEWLPYPAAPGEKWIDVSINKHTLTAYEGAKVVKGPFAVFTGARDKGFYTVTGTYKIYHKLNSQNMSGPGYSVPNVPKVMYFYQGWAIHGAPWVNESLEKHGKGKDYSHGCVNVPTNNGYHDWLYNWAPVGTPVRTHY